MDIDTYDLATQISQHLSGWQVGEPHDSSGSPRRYATLEHETGAAIAIYHDVYRRRLSLYGIYPRRDGQSTQPHDWGVLPYSAAAPAIKASPTRAPRALARDIERRLITDYMPLYAACVRAQGKHDASEEDRRSHIERYAVACGGTVRDNRVSVYRETEHETVMGDIHVSVDGSVRFENFYAPREAAEKILEIIGAI